MSTRRLVSEKQAMLVRKMAKDKKVSCDVFQAAIEDGRLSTYLDSLKEDLSSLDLSTLVPPPGARTHVFRGVRVKLDREWQEAVNAAGPNTPDNYNVRKVGDLYLPSGKGEIVEDLIGLNYPDGSGNWDKALAWAKEQQLQKTVPREAFAVSEQYPKLHVQLGMDPMYVVATEECTFDGFQLACSVWWGGSGREADLFWISHFSERHGWFVFRKPVLSTKRL